MDKTHAMEKLSSPLGKDEAAAPMLSFPQAYEGYMTCSALCFSACPARGSLYLPSPCPLVLLGPSLAAPFVAREWEGTGLNYLLASSCKMLDKMTCISPSGPQSLSCLFESPSPQARLFMTVSVSQAALQGTDHKRFTKEETRAQRGKNIT